MVLGDGRFDARDRTRVFTRCRKAFTRRKTLKVTYRLGNGVVVGTDGVGFASSYDVGDAECADDGDDNDANVDIDGEHESEVA